MPASRVVAFAVVLGIALVARPSAASPGRNPALGPGPAPLLARESAVRWWFAFKLNGAIFPACGAAMASACPFGGTPQHYSGPAGLQYVYASSKDVTLRQGAGCAGETTSDPIGATYAEIYNGPYHYVVWNDQFEGDPPIQGCGDSCTAPWGHSKGMVAWDDDGNGVVMQVTTPSWPASGSKAHPRKSGNTLGCVIDDDVEFSQQFFALKLTKSDLMKVLGAMQNASVVTDTSNPQLVRNGGPADVAQIVDLLGRRSSSTATTNERLSSGVRVISKPSHLQVPPWQLVSAMLGGVPLRVATWWGNPNEIATTTASTPVTCWDDTVASPGAVVNATSGTWAHKTFGLTEGPGSPAGNANHAKIGVSTDKSSNYVIFGDMNQQGALSGSDGCDHSQNGRGGIFYIVTNATLHKGVRSLIGG